MLSFDSPLSYNPRSFQGHNNTIHDDISFCALVSRGHMQGSGEF